MIRTLSIVGVVLGAVFVLSLAVASGASAESQLTSDGPVKLTGKDAEGEKATLTGFGLTTSCQGEYTVGLENQTPHTFFDPSLLFVAIFTVAPHYTNCTTKLGESSVSDTVTMNGCDYLVHLGNGAEHWEVVCPESQQIEIHSYSGSSHLSSICTVKIPGQTGISGGAVENIEEGGVKKLQVKEPLSSIKATKTGILCGGSSETENASMDIHAIISGVNEEGKATGISISP